MPGQEGGMAAADDQTFVAVIQEYAPRLYRHLLRLLQDPQDAEDALQETFLKAYQHLGDFRGQARLSTWLYRIATNEALMQLRRKNPTIFSLEALQGDDAYPDEILLNQWQILPEQAALSAEMRQVLERAVQRLSPALRVVFLLRDVEGFSTRETAEILGISSDAVKTRLSRARLRLREALARYFQGSASQRSEAAL
ncbi:MAG: sigma-70 family RNA polymerase sigma factor [Chloroflexi bacterium]|nr:sigma-70 family RNA polymerase sigma factor [Chloroflexota bacterium]